MISPTRSLGNVGLWFNFRHFTYINLILNGFVLADMINEIYTHYLRNRAPQTVYI